MRFEIMWKNMKFIFSKKFPGSNNNTYSWIVFFFYDVWMNISIYLKFKKFFWSCKLNANENHSIAKLKCIGINVNWMIFSQPYESSSVILIDFLYQWKLRPMVWGTNSANLSLQFGT